MPPDPVGRRERSRARPPPRWARPLLAPFGRCPAPMPPAPVGRRERSRARPPPAVGAGVFARAPSVLGPLRGLRTAGCPQTPSAGVNALAAPATLQACGGLGRAKPAGPRLLRRRVRSRGGPAEDPV